MEMKNDDHLTLEQNDRDNIWHHLSKYNEEKSPMIIKKAEGSWITTTKGEKFLDGMSGLWCVNVGYGRQELVETASEQMKELSFAPLTQSHIPAIKLAKKLNELLEDDYLIFYSNSGSDANETAFKLVRQYHQQNGDYARQKFISRYRAYHGSTFGALAATGQAIRKYKYEPLAQGFLHVAPPDNYRKPKEKAIKEYNLDCAKELEQKILWEQKETVAGIIMEPLITGGGVLIPDPIYIKEVERICKKYGILLIIDEVICGFGRTGKMFGHQHFNIKPDIVTMAKGLTSGYMPLSVTAIRKDLFEVFNKDEAYSHFRHINTFGGNPAACALTLKNIEIIERENLVEQSRLLGERLREQLISLENHPHVGDIRGIGLIIGIEIVKDKETKQPISDEAMDIILKECKENGVILGRNGETVENFNNILMVGPPLSSTMEDIGIIANVLLKVLGKYTEMD